MAGVRIFLVDDEADVTRGLSWLLESVNLPSTAYNLAETFLAELFSYPGPACAVLDLRMPGLSGIELMEKVTPLRPDVPIIFLSAHGDVPSAVRAMKLGALDFLLKPFNPQQFLECINRATRSAEERHADWLKRRDDDRSLARLSAREREVMEHTLAGRSSKEIGRELEISPKTVDVHRANILRKLEVGTARELASRFRAAAPRKEQ
ncbi:MAG: response regulator transcription factor [Panacagrimonas sp.]